MDKRQRLVVIAVALVIVIMTGIYLFYLEGEPEQVKIKVGGKPQTWWILPSAVSWRYSPDKTIVNWSGEYSITLRGHHNILPYIVYKLELRATGISSEYEVDSIQIVQR